MLTDRGLEAALEALVKRAPVPVELRVDVQEQGDDAIEAAAYFLVSEALTNIAKHAQADAASVEVEGGGGTVAVTIADDGVGAADAAAGSGLTGLADRVNAVGGRLEVSSAQGEGTRIRAVLPTSVLGSLNGS